MLTRDYKGRILRVTVRDEDFEYEVRIYRSLSAIAARLVFATALWCIVV